jgi:hypothetical protein
VGILLGRRALRPPIIPSNYRIVPEALLSIQQRAIVNEILRSDADSFKYPAARVSPSDGQLTWLITADAMGNLPIR